MMGKVLFTGGTLEQAHLELFVAAGLEVVVAPSDLDEENLISALAGCDGYLLAGLEKVTSSVLKAVSGRLKVIAFMGTGYQSFVDADAAADLGIFVTNAPGMNASAVAEFAVALLLEMVRQPRQKSNEVKGGYWKEISTGTVIGRTVGIVGCGSIGSKFARMVHHAFGARVLYYSRSQKKALEAEIGAEFVSLHQLLSEADVISLHVPYSKETIGMLGLEEFQIIKPGSLIVCTARPETMDVGALKNSLLSGRVAGLAMDGYYCEPAPRPEEDFYGLLNLSQTIITPHMASLSDEALTKTISVNVKSIANILAGLNDSYVVNPSVR